MKKLIMILSALLCLTMLFASCDSEPTDELAEETTTQAETTAPAPTETPIETAPEPIPEELKIDYDAILAQWSEYISFEGETEEEAIVYSDLAELFSHSSNWSEHSNFSEDLNVQQVGNLALFTYHSSTYDTVYDAYEGDYEDVTTHNYRYSIFNIVTGEKVFEKQHTYRYYPYRSSADRFDYPQVQFAPSMAHVGNGVIRVDITTNEAIRDDFDRIIAWESQTSYDYYDLNGKLLVENLETDDFQVVSVSFAHQTIIRIGGKYFLVKDGEIVAKLGTEMQVRLDFGADEYNGLQYLWTDGRVQVLDTAANRITVDWDYRSFFEQREGYLSTYTLGNGNILFQKYCDVADDEGIQFGSAYYAPLFALVDAKTGAVSKITPTCVIDGVTYEYVIDSLINNANDQNTGLAMKNGDYQLAEIYLISDGIVAPKTTLAILDSQLQVVATLDRFLQDQDGIYGMLENGDLLIRTESGLYYTVDVDGSGTQKVQLFVAPRSVKLFVDGGFLARDGILYNDSLQPLVSLYDDEYGSYSSFGDGLRAWSNEDCCYHYLSINSAGELEIKYAPETGTYQASFSYGDCTVYKTVNPNSWYGSDQPYVYTVYNAQGQLIETLFGENCVVTYGMLKLTSGSTSTYYILK